MDTILSGGIHIRSPKCWMAGIPMELAVGLSAPITPKSGVMRLESLMEAVIRKLSESGLNLPIKTKLTL